MSPRTINALATLLGVGAVLALGAFSLRPRPPRFEVVGQTVQPVAGQGRCVVIDVAGPRWRDRTPLMFGRGIRIVDASGRVVPFEARPMGGFASPPSLVVRCGYRAPIVSPRLELWRDGRRVATARLGPFPAPVVNRLSVTERPLFQCLARPDPEGFSSSVTALPTKPLPKDEAWALHLVSTRHATGLDAWAPLLPGTPQGATLPVPFPEEAGAVEVEVHRFRSEVKTDAIPLPNLRLVSVNGQTALKADRERDLGAHFGVHLYLQAGVPGLSRLQRDADRRLPYGYVGAKGAPYVAPRRSPVSPPESLAADLAVPDFERLNVRSIGLSLNQTGLPSAGMVRSGDPPGPVSTRPFDATLRISQTRWRPVGRVRQVVAVEAPNAR